MDELREMLERLGELSSQELETLRTKLQELAAEVAERGEFTPEDVSLLGEIADSVEKVADKLNELSASEAERQTAAEAALARINGQADGDEDEEDDDEGGDGGNDDDAGDDDASGSSAEKPEKVSVTASTRVKGEQIITTRPRPRASLRDVSDRRPATAAPRAALADREARGTMRSTLTGEAFSSVEDLVEAMVSKRENLGRGGADGEKIPVGRIKAKYPENRSIKAHQGDAAQNEKVFRQFTSREVVTAALEPNGPGFTASGGICAPAAPLYDVVNISVADRPFRDSLSQIEAGRGRVLWLPPLDITDFQDAVDQWTEANDANPGSDGPAVKPCLHVTCPDEQDAVIYAITRCLEFGNLMARTFPERVEEAIVKTLAWQARFAERTLLSGWDGYATANVSTGQLLGAARDILTHLDRAATQRRRQYRTGKNFPIEVWMQDYVLRMMVTDLARQLPGDDALGTAEAEILGYFRDRNLIVHWLMDDPDATQEMSASQGTAEGNGAPLNGWPTRVKARMSHPGAFSVMDEGVLDLGLVRDSTLNSTNDYQLFAETFEQIIFRGMFAHILNMDVCPDGATSGTVDIDPCTSGS